VEESASKELVSFNGDLLRALEQGMKSIGKDVRVLKSNYTSDGIEATLLFKEPRGTVRRYKMKITKQYGVTPDLPEDVKMDSEVKEATKENTPFEPEAMAEDLAKSLGEEFKEEISESLDISKGRYSDFGSAGEFTADGQKYNVIESEDEAERIAKDIVKQDLESEPSLFSPDFLQQHLYISPTDRRIIAGEEADALAEGQSDEDFVEANGTKEQWEAEEADGDTEGAQKLVDAAKEEWVSDQSDKIEKELEDPIEYFINDHGIYGDVGELMKANFIQVDIDEATDEAVRIDGWAHFLSHYDGNYETTAGGLVYFRED